MTADALLPSARRTPRPKPHRMAVLVLAGVSAIDLGVPVQVFGAESNSVGQVPGTASAHALTAPRLSSTEEGRVRRA